MTSTLRIGFVSSRLNHWTNGRFCQSNFPLWYHSRRLADSGVRIDFLDPARSVRRNRTYDWVWIDSRASLPRDVHRAEFSRDLCKKYRGCAGRTAYLDNSDSGGTANLELLDTFDRYFKKQVYADRRRYQLAEHQNRIHCNFYASRYGIRDCRTAPARSPISESELSRLRISWNILLSNNYAAGRLHRARTGLWRRQLPKPFPWSQRCQAVFARWSDSHALASVGEPRREIAKRLSCESGRAIRYAVGVCAAGQYRREIVRAVGVVSPFGWGEICYRDLEAFVVGAALLEPSVDHLETWPPLFVPGETYVSLPWAYDELVAAVALAVGQDGLLRHIAETGQSRLRKYWDSDGADLFADRVRSMLA